MSEPIPEDLVVDPDFPPEDPIVPDYPAPEPGPELPVADGWMEAEVSGARVNVFDAPIVAGDPEGARLEIRSTGFHAFNGTGTETAHIDGQEGVFVGGEFRTSDALPGQVVFSDTAFVSSDTGGAGRPGFSIQPPDMTNVAIPPGVGHDTNGGVRLDGGKAMSGESSVITARPAASILRTYQANGHLGGAIQTSPSASFMRTTHADGTIGGEVQTSPSESFMRTSGDEATGRSFARVNSQQVSMNVTSLDGLNTARITASDRTVTLFSATGGQRYLRLDETGIWVEVGGKSYNLEETAQDSGWQAFASPGFDSYALAWRNKGGVIYLRGTITATWTAGWTTVTTGLPAEMRPDIRVIRSAPSTSEQGLYFRVGNDGVLEFYKPSSGTRTADLSAVFYPAD